MPKAAAARPVERRHQLTARPVCAKFQRQYESRIFQKKAARFALALVVTLVITHNKILATNLSTVQSHS
jgi:hypothetical protein